MFLRRGTSTLHHLRAEHPAAHPARTRTDRVDANRWKAKGSRREQAAEQDRAAGGRDRRRVSTEDGRTALGALWFKRVDGYVYAYLRYTSGGKAVARYIGPVAADSRADALREAWAEVHRRGVTAAAS